MANRVGSALHGTLAARTPRTDVAFVRWIYRAPSDGTGFAGPGVTEFSIESRSAHFPAPSQLVRPVPSSGQEVERRGNENDEVARMTKQRE